MVGGHSNVSTNPTIWIMIIFKNYGNHTQKMKSLNKVLPDDTLDHQRTSYKTTTKVHVFLT